MKKVLVLFGVIIILPWQLICQETEYVSKQDLQAEKSQLLRSIYTLDKNNQELKSMLLFEVQANDSLAELVTLQSAELLAQKEFLQNMEISQTDLDNRLLNQRKSGTLMVILIPAGLFLLFLLLLIWLIIFRHRTLAMFNNVFDRSNELSKQLEDQLNTAKKENEAIRSEIRSSAKETETLLQKFSAETTEKFQNLEKLLNEEKALHNATHQQSHEEYEALKGSLQKGYDLISKDMGIVKEELVNTTKDFIARLKEATKKSRDDT